MDSDVRYHPRMRVVAALLVFVVVNVAHADVLPEPGRVDWPDTPMPMPNGSVVLGVGVALVLAAIAVIWPASGRTRNP
jgi:preprotein translocase subunit Sec61beta